jgi:thiol-disulfide isomerase/thioredoxin
MYALIMAVTLLLASPEHSYNDALDVHNDTGKPLVVLVHADWCPPCQRIKHQSIPKVRNLDKAAYGELDYDQHERTAKEMMQGASVPQIIVFVKKDGEYHKTVHHGFRTSAQIEAIIDAAHLQSFPKSDP